MYEVGRPVLVGTTTIEKSELLAALLSEYQVPYNLLNARPENVESESKTIAQAGCKKAVTIATNMAGRGTDILLGGNPAFLIRSLIKNYFSDEIDPEYQPLFDNALQGIDEKTQKELALKYSTFMERTIPDIKTDGTLTSKAFVQLYETVFTGVKQRIIDEGTEVRQLGGLHVIGTERHESRRIDNQLRGRSGRQGDPGSSKFFLSLEDQLLRIFGGEKILGIMQNVGFDDTTPIQSEFLTKSLDSAQKKVEAYYFDMRKQVFDYEEALTSQRNAVYNERRRILEQSNLKNWILDYAERTLYDIFSCLKTNPDSNVKNLLSTKLQNLLGVPFSITVTNEKSEVDQLILFLQQQVQISYDLKELELENCQPGLLRALEKSFILQQIDYSWKDHLQKVVLLRDSIRWRAYGQKDPLTEYKREVFNYYTVLLAKIRHRVVYFAMRAKVIFS